MHKVTIDNGTMGHDDGVAGFLGRATYPVGFAGRHGASVAFSMFDEARRASHHGPRGDVASPRAGFYISGGLVAASPRGRAGSIAVKKLQTIRVNACYFALIWI